MQILISHPSPIMSARLRNILMAMPEVSGCATASSLTDTYNFAEHHKPNCVVMAASFADCAEFELLDTLFRIIGIGCVLMTDRPDGRLSSLSLKARAHVVLVSGQIEGVALVEAIKKASRHDALLPSVTPQNQCNTRFDPKKIILIGASTGGIDALIKTTQAFSETCPPTLIVQHTGGSFAKSLIRLLNSATDARVEEAQDGVTLNPGHIYLPPGNAAHLCLHKGSTARIALCDGSPVSGHRPSVDALFSSALPFADRVVAALLTGMGRDGASGLTALRHAGATTIGQDQATSVVYGMPRIAKEMGGVDQEVPLDKIGPTLLAECRARARA